MPYVINSHALTGEKPCINKTIHALLMHGYATFNIIVPGPQICCRYEMCTAWPYNEQSPWKLRSWDIGEKAKQNSARNNAKRSKCFQFLCNNRDQTWFFNALTFTGFLGRCWKPRPWASVFNPSHGTWRMLMHEKPCLIPILNTVDPAYSKIFSFSKLWYHNRIRLIVRHRVWPDFHIVGLVVFI